MIEKLFGEVVLKDLIKEKYLLLKNVKEANTWLKENYKGIEKVLTRNQKDVIQSYCGSSNGLFYDYMSKDRYMRKEYNPQFRETMDNNIKEFEKAIYRYPLRENIIVFRWVSYDRLMSLFEQGNKDISKAKEGDIIKYRTFLSTTIAYENKNFPGSQAYHIKEDKECLLVIKVPKGEGAIYTGGEGANELGNSDEYELVFAPKKRLKLEKTYEYLGEPTKRYNKIFIFEMLAG